MYQFLSRHPIVVDDAVDVAHHATPFGMRSISTDDFQVSVFLEIADVILNRSIVFDAVDLAKRALIGPCKALVVGIRANDHQTLEICRL